MASGHGHGSMSLSMKLIRLLIVLFNLAFVVVGAVVLAIGVFVFKDPKMHQLRPLLNPDLVSSYSQSLSNIDTFAIAIIVIGSVLLVIGFLGCCGAIKGFRFLHVVYAVIIGAIILAEIAIVVVFIAYQQRFRSELVGRLQESIVKFYVGTPVNGSKSANPVSLSWDFAQFNLKCCGVVGPNDFSRAGNWSRQDPYQSGANLTVPFTCCPLNATTSWTELPTDFSAAKACATTGANAFKQGCYDRLILIIADYKKNVIIGGVIVGVIEVLAFIFAIILYCRKTDYSSL
jgi:vacuolar-type H+-ATPase subunit I/STV1